MKIFQTITLAAFALTLAACNSNEETNQNTNSAGDIAPTNTQVTTDHGAEDKSETNVGFELSGGNIEEATNVPEKEKTALIDSFTEYMESFNEEDIKRYMNTISKNPEGFNYDDEKIMVEKTFNDYDTIRTADNITIIKYDKSQAQVFSNIHTSLKQTDTGAKLDQNGRQVTVFVNEDDKWLVSSVYYIGETTE
ncbi:nuclear transport factor 2 family protein [Psychrobacillus sp. INOP01]|uniref:nuclear transport factor 2 family protein n=1 Tax=Psychrobacillus sp. INOP01 TaxID=2829187 RepID=UPI001BA88356|nr:nuclear transport factor 2 family protein [Psychrobacillus sp. INOP01]QUG40781.1 nuclear transport factor 2 family protein [Psychrobacillus sp. INOP01]